MSSAHDGAALRRYRNLGQLLKAYREYRDMDQSQFGAAVGVEAKAVSRWEMGSNVPSDETLESLARAHHFPYSLLLELRAGLRAWYDVRTNRMATSPFDRDFVNKKIIEEDLFLDGTQLAADVSPAEVNRDLEALLEIETRLFFPPVHARSLFHTAIARAQAVNLVLHTRQDLVSRDKGLLHEGHLLCFPIDNDSFKRISTDPSSEIEMAPTEVCSFLDDKVAALHIYALYATTSTHAYALLRHFVDQLMAPWETLTKRGLTLSWYAVTPEERECASKMGLNMQPRRGQQGISRDGFEPRFYSAPLASLAWIANYRRRRNLHRNVVD